MRKNEKRSRLSLALILLLALVCIAPLTACQSLIARTDPAQECDHPAKPVPPYTDSEVAEYSIAQAERIDVCRSLLGNKPRLT